MDKFKMAKALDLNTIEKNTIDCTPTWLGLLPVMLQVIKDSAQSYNSEINSNAKFMEQEFRKMAIAADRWNEYCKELANATD